MSKSLIIRLAGFLIGSFGCAVTGSAYYYYVHFPGHSGPFNPILERFDLTTLQNKTVNLFVSDQGPAFLYPSDTYPAIVSEIRSAAKVWNDVPTSDIRLAYGGLFTSGTQETAPGIDVEFSDDIPPGVLALGGPRSRGDVTFGPNGAFVPILRSKVLLRRDMSQISSFGESFFVTLVHEFGHALGLQHTLTSSVMSTLQTSVSTKAAPLGADDVAGISLLYPAGNYLSTVGGITGRVTMNGSGVNLASVVAIPQSGPAISSLTNPDGTYQISGLAPGQPYLVYAHPLPQPLQGQGETTAANINYPVDANSSSNGFQPNYVAFATQFYPGTRDWAQARPIFVTPGSLVSGIDIGVNPRNSQAIASVRMYGYSQTSLAETSTPLTPGTPASVVAGGVGLLQDNGSLTTGLDVSVLGGGPTQVYNLHPWVGPNIVMAIYVPLGVGSGPKHLLFSTPNDLYVLPSGFSVVNNAPPSIYSASPVFDSSGARVAAISGANMASDTRILFDGLPGVLEGIAADGRILVIPPPAPSGYTATVVALNSDGQSSLFLQGPSPASFTYDVTPDSPALTVSPGFLSPGGDTVVDVVNTSLNSGFVDGQTVVGFGTSDVLVKKVTVLGANHLQALVSSTVFASTNSISVTTGLKILSQSQGTPVNAGH